MLLISVIWSLSGFYLPILLLDCVPIKEYSHCFSLSDIYSFMVNDVARKHINSWNKYSFWLNKNMRVISLILWTAFLAYRLIETLIINLSTRTSIIDCGVCTSYQSVFHLDCGVFPTKRLCFRPSRSMTLTKKINPLKNQQRFIHNH
jgi:hypothetical protein